MADSGNGGVAGNTLAQVKAMLNNSSLPKKTKTTPSWKREEPEQLVPWLDDLDAIFETANITNDWVKIQKVLEWMEYATKNEMSRLELVKKSHLEANWEEFKKELTACFSEAVADYEGSRDKLERIVLKYKLIPMDRLDKALAFNRAFKIEVQKLLLAKLNPLISNTEAVKLYAMAFEKRLMCEALSKARRVCMPDLHGQRRDDVFKLDELIRAVESVMYMGAVLYMSEDEEFETALWNNKCG
ncbi:hypothetical protein Moror_9187 [Moniliophthora roreri MCA 2997]|uniref:Retrotransposon gag domain-containing protein n=1 Tax=Moniliophthora roreri (strain MCA 2997) TaxID=1381753 RepID=V2WGC4_MONRO|nr:hypothetical protein Moror_9187 [Moniliophthora roreri MCA 2997]